MSFITSFFANLYNAIGMYFARRQVNAIKRYHYRIQQEWISGDSNHAHEIHVYTQIHKLLIASQLFMDSHQYTFAQRELESAYDLSEQFGYPGLREYIDYMRCLMVSRKYGVISCHLRLITK